MSIVRTAIRLAVQVVATREIAAARANRSAARQVFRQDLAVFRGVSGGAGVAGSPTRDRPGREGRESTGDLHRRPIEVIALDDEQGDQHELDVRLQPAW